MELGNEMRNIFKFNQNCTSFDGTEWLFLGFELILSAKGIFLRLPRNGMVSGIGS